MKTYVEAQKPASEVWTDILTHSGDGHTIQVDLFDADGDLTESPQDAQSAAFICMSHDDGAYIAELERP